MNSSIKGKINQSLSNSQINKITRKSSEDQELLTLFSNDQLTAIDNIITDNLNTSENLNELSESRILNNIGQTFFEVLTEQPHKFTENDELYNNKKSSFIDINWNYNNIIINDNSVIKGLSFNTSNKDRQLPYINNIIIEIQGYVNNNLTQWLNLDTITALEDLIDSEKFDSLSSKKFCKIGKQTQ